MNRLHPTTDEWPLLATIEPPDPRMRPRLARGRVHYLTRCAICGVVIGPSPFTVCSDCWDDYYKGGNR